MREMSGFGVITVSRPRAGPPETGAKGGEPHDGTGVQP